jgi:hypothetical protein
MAFQLPQPVPQIIAQIADEANPTLQEVNAFQAAVVRYTQDILNHLVFLNPNHGFNQRVPLPSVVASTNDELILKVTQLRDHVNALFPIYGLAYMTAAQQFVAAAAAPVPAPPPAAPVARPPKTKLPSEFLGKSAASARHFVQQCCNYIQITPFPDPETEVRWVLQLCEGDTAQWRDELLSHYDDLLVPQYLLDFDDFVRHFKARWTDPHESEKAMDRIMNHTIRQKTSVKKYNDEFNEALTLANMTGADRAMLRAYETGLKTQVRNAAVVAILQTPNMTFFERQALMVRLDETLEQTRERQPSTTPTRTMINNPVFNVANPTRARSETPGRQSTPIKVEVARQYTKLTPTE